MTNLLLIRPQSAGGSFKNNSHLKILTQYFMILLNASLKQNRTKFSKIHS